MRLKRIETDTNIQAPGGGDLQKYLDVSVVKDLELHYDGELVHVIRGVLDYFIPISRITRLWPYDQRISIEDFKEELEAQPVAKTKAKKKAAL